MIQPGLTQHTLCTGWHCHMAPVKDTATLVPSVLPPRTQRCLPPLHHLVNPFLVNASFCSGPWRSLCMFRHATRRLGEPFSSLQIKLWSRLDPTAKKLKHMSVDSDLSNMLSCLSVFGLSPPVSWELGVFRFAHGSHTVTLAFRHENLSREKNYKKFPFGDM
jgi:hypothetical protein